MPKETEAMDRENKEKNIPDANSLRTRGAAEDCKHTLRIDSLCALCGKELAHDEQLVPVLHSSDKLFQTAEVAEAFQKKNNRKLRDGGKMILILDLDQTILHTTMEECECDFTFVSDALSFYVKLRPHLKTFLRAASALFEIHIYTMGTREYARAICDHIDPRGRYFGNRIVTRSENFNELKKSIGRITCISRNVVILDDRADVWEYCENLVLIRPFWHHDRIDINDPSKELPCYVTKDELGGNHYAVADTDSSHEMEDLKETIFILCSNNLEEVHESLVVSRKVGAKHPLRDAPEAKRRKIVDDLGCSHDDALLRVLKVFRSVHRRFFKTNKHARRLLRLKFFKNFKIATNPKYHSLVQFSGATLSFDNPKYVLEDEKLARQLKALNLQAQWLNECIYQRVLVDARDYVIADYRVTDEYQKELEDEFFNL